MVASGAQFALWRRPPKMTPRFALLLVVLSYGGSVADWIEIPHLTPSVAPKVTPLATNRRIATSQRPHFLTSSNVFSHLVDSPGRRPATVSDLLDNDHGAFSYQQHPRSHETVPPDGPPVDVSSKLSWSTERASDHEPTASEESAEEDDGGNGDAELPFGNRYEEESIEVLPTTEAVPVGQPPTDRFHDFDDYDDYDERSGERIVPDHGNRTTDRHPGHITVIQISPQLAPVAHEPKRKPLGVVGFIDFLKRMQANFVLRTARTINDKIRVLADLKDQLLTSIEQRFAALWADRRRRPSVASGRSGRIKRGWMEHGTGGMDFPSAEGALLTISFLTFAVFLIKLVLMVINTIKAKHYTYSTLMPANALSGSLLKVVQQRSAADDDSTNDNAAILAAINDFRYA